MALDLFETSRNLEHEAKALYEQGLKLNKSENLRKLWQMLIKIEENHSDLLVDIQKKKKPSPIKHIDYKIVRQIFNTLKDEKFSNEEIKCFEKMLTSEKKSEDYYKENSKDNPIILEIAKEEHRHFVVIKNLIDLLKRPKQWVESEEFKLLDNY